MTGALSRRKRGALVAGLTVITALAAITPHIDAPFRRLVKYHGDSGAPITTSAIDVAALARAGSILPSGSSYYVDVPPDSASPEAAQIRNDVEGVTGLYFAPSLRVFRISDANWLLAYGVGTALPPPASALKRYTVGDGIYLVQIK